MRKKCELEEACRIVLGGYERDIPERCPECTDLVKFTLGCMILHDINLKEDAAWRGNCLD